MRAADAALTPDPRAAEHAGRVAGQKLQRAGVQGTAVKREAGRFGRAMWTPFARASGVLWLEFTGVFFGLFALTAAIEVVRHRADFALTGPARQHVWFAAGMLALFAWFAVTSFTRARRQSRAGRNPGRGPR